MEMASAASSSSPSSASPSRPPRPPRSRPVSTSGGPTHAAAAAAAAAAASSSSPSLSPLPSWSRRIHATPPSRDDVSPSSEHGYELLYSKSRVTLHPTPYARDNIPGYLALLRRKRISRNDDDDELRSASEAAPSSSSTPMQRQATLQDNSKHVVLAWLPEELVQDRSETAKFVDVELREAEGTLERGEEEMECEVRDGHSGRVMRLREVVEEESILVEPPPIGSASPCPTSPASYAFSHQLGDLYSLNVVPPTISNWYGSLTVSLVGGETLPPLYFHDDESRSTILSMLRASKGSASGTSPQGLRYPPSNGMKGSPTSTSTANATSGSSIWGGDELVQHLRKYAFIHRSVHDHRVFLVNPSPSDLDMHSTPTFADDAIDPRPRRSIADESSFSSFSSDVVFPDDPFSPNYPSNYGRGGRGGSGDQTPESFSSWAKATRFSLLSHFSHVTKSARDASRQMMTSPATRPYASKLPAAVQSFAQAGPVGPFSPTKDDEVKTISQKAGVVEYDSARVYLAKWARLVAEEGEKNKKQEDVATAAAAVAAAGRNGDGGDSGDGTAVEEGGLGVFEIVNGRSAAVTTSPASAAEAMKSTQRNYDPITLSEWETWFSSHDGRPTISFSEVKSRIFSRGLAESARKAAWPLLLGAIPWDTTFEEREAYWARRRREYANLKAVWAGDTPSARRIREREDVVDQRHRVRVDCLRTDRKHDMFAMGAKTDGDGGERTTSAPSSPTTRTTTPTIADLDSSVLLSGLSPRQAGQSVSSNPHIITLGEILLTYVFYDTLGPDADAAWAESQRINDTELGGYVQGMSDLCAPIYVTAQGDEAEAFWCFVSFMDRMRPNFLPSQVAMSTQLVSLQTLLRLADPELYQHLKDLDGLNLFFCFRWLLILFKRELAFEDSKRVWEVCWAAEGSHESSTSTSTGTALINGDNDDDGDNDDGDNDDSCPLRTSTTPHTPRTPHTPHFHLFLCLSLLLHHRGPTLDHLTCFDEVLQYFQSLSGNIDVEELIAGAEKVWRELFLVASSSSSSSSSASAFTTAANGKSESSRSSPSPIPTGTRTAAGAHKTATSTSKEKAATSAAARTAMTAMTAEAEAGEDGEMEKLRRLVGL